MDDKIVSMLLQKLVDRADEVDGDELMGSMKPLEIEDGIDTSRFTAKDEEDEDDDEAAKIVKLFK